jgi:hypothetical protein
MFQHFLGDYGKKLIANKDFQNIKEGKIRQYIKYNNEEMLKEIIVCFIYHMFMHILREKFDGK